MTESIETCCSRTLRQLGRFSPIAVIRNYSTCPRQGLDELQEFAALCLLVAGPNRLLNTMCDVVLQNLGFYFFERGNHRLDLSDNVEAVALGLDHAGEAANLTFDAVETNQASFLRVALHGLMYTPLGYMKQQSHLSTISATGDTI
jgi:hypothetical protein